MARGEVQRILLWTCWALNTLLGSAYFIMCFAISQKLMQATGYQLQSTLHNSVFRAPIAATVIGGVMVMLFDILSCVVLIRRTINKTGPSFGYGFLIAWCFVLSFMTLLCGLIMEGFSDTVGKDLQSTPGWTKYHHGAYIGTYVFAYICCGMFMFFFVCLIIFQGGITKTLGIYEQMVNFQRMQEMQNPGLAYPMAGMPVYGMNMNMNVGATA